MAFVLFALIGSVVGLVARGTLPACHKLGVVMVLSLAIEGAMLGGLVLSFVSRTEFHTAEVLGSLVGAIAVLAAAGGFRTAARPTAVSTNVVSNRAPKVAQPAPAVPLLSFNCDQP